MKYFFIAAFLCALVSGCAKLELVNSVNPIPGNDPPAKPSNPLPSDSSINQNRFVTLRWECTDPDAGDSLRYDIYFGSTNPPPLVADSIRIKSYDAGITSANTLLFWKIRVKDKEGASAESPVWRFTTSN